MTLNNTGILKTNSLQPINNSACYNLLNNHSTSASINFGGLLSNINVFGNLNINTLNPVSTLMNIGSFIFNTNAIFSSTPSSSVGLFSNNTGTVNVGGNGTVNIGGSGGINLAKQNFQYVEIGTSINTNAYIDFHSSNNTVDYDSRIIATGGTSTAGNGTLTMNGATVATNATNVNITATTFNINSNPFRYIPWTTYLGTPASFNLAGIIYPAGANAPKCNSAATDSYRFTVIGNTMYINFYLYQASVGTGGNGVYQYELP